MEDADESNLTIETLKKQYEVVRLRVSQNDTYMQGSHVEAFGAVREMGEDAVGEYLGAGGPAPLPFHRPRGANGLRGGAAALPQRDADLAPLYAAVAASASNEGGEAHARALRALGAELARRAGVDARVRAAVTLVARGGTPFRAANGASAEAIFAAPDPARAGRALVDDWDCLRGAIGAWEARCGALDQYGMRHSRAFANLCNLGVTPAQLDVAALAVCSDAAVADA